MIQEKNVLIEKMNHIIGEKAQAMDMIAKLQTEMADIKEKYENDRSDNLPVERSEINLKYIPLEKAKSNFNFSYLFESYN